jgi:hypothetical protein
VRRRAAPVEARQQPGVRPAAFEPGRAEAGHERREGQRVRTECEQDLVQGPAAADRLGDPSEQVEGQAGHAARRLAGLELELAVAPGEAVAEAAP